MNIVELLMKAGLAKEAAEKAAPDLKAAFDAEVKVHADKAADAEARAGRILAEKKEVQAKLETVTTERDEAKRAGMSEADRAKAEKADRERKDNEAAAERTRLANELAAERRGRAVDGIAARYRFRKDLPDGLARRELEGYLNGIDLADNAAVTTKLKAFEDSHKALIVTDTPGGTGDRGGAGDGTKGGGGDVEDATRQSASERAAYLQKQTSPAGRA